MDHSVRDRLDALEALAESVGPLMQGPSGALQSHFSARPGFLNLFNAGAFVTDAQGVVLASVPPSVGRVGMDYRQRDYVESVLKSGKPVVSAPYFGKLLGRPALAMAVPLRNAQGVVLGVVAGVTDLQTANFLDDIMQGHYGSGRAYSALIDPGLRQIITSSDKRMVLAKIAAPGVSADIDRFLAGFEGSAEVTNALGLRVLTSDKRVGLTGWLAVVALPLDEAYAPIRRMQWRMALASILLSTGAAVLTWLVLRRSFAPLQLARDALAAQSQSGSQLQALPQTSEDEIGALVQGFNTVLASAAERGRALAESEKLFRTAFWTMPDAINITRMSDGMYLEVNQGFERLTGWTYAESVGRTALEMGIWHNPDDRRRLVQTLQQDGHIERLEAEFCTKDGRVWTGQMSARRLTLNGEACLLSMTQDVTAQIKAEQQLRLAASVFDHAREGVTITDAQGTILDVNAAFTRITGYSRAEALGQNPRILKSGRHTEAFYAALWSDLLAQGYWSGEIWNRRKNGEVYPEKMTVSRVCDDAGRVQHFVALFSDVSESKRLEEQVHRLAFYDPLTRLPNRRLLDDRLQQSMVASKRSGFYVALMMLDLDNFKPLNDTHGHLVGDLLLVEVARRLSECLREIDTVARFGGDEFVVLLNDLHTEREVSAAQAGQVAEKIRLSLQEMYQLEVQHPGQAATQVQHHCSVSIGMVIFIDHEADPSDILKWADLAMYQAKQAGRNCVQEFLMPTIPA